MYIPRNISIQKLLEPGKVLLIYGPRQSCKTSLVQNYLETTDFKYKFIRGEYSNVKEMPGALCETIHQKNYRRFVT